MCSTEIGHFFLNQDQNCRNQLKLRWHLKLGGVFKYVLFSPVFVGDFQFDEHIFQMGGSTTNQ